jgi:3-phosphoshikimate 1-carboxyvinyltransferase
MKINKIEKPIKGEINAPPSKSYTHRVLFAAALAHDKLLVRNPLICDDTLATVNALRAYGVGIDVNSNILVNSPERFEAPEKTDVGKSGTTLRFLISFAALAEYMNPPFSIIHGAKRPVGPLTYALQDLGVKAIASQRFPPIYMQGSGIKGGSTTLDCSESSQYLSSLLLAAPCAEQPVTIHVTNLKSRPYVDATLDTMLQFGVRVKNNEYIEFQIDPQRYIPAAISVEGDWSSASYFFALAALTKGDITVKNLNPESKQGDRYFLEILKQMGCTVIYHKDGAQVIGSDLEGIAIDMADYPDIVPTLAAVAPFASSPITIENIAHLELKESKRITALATELQRMGIKVEKTDHSLKIYPGIPNPAEIKTYDDHRIAMAFSIAALATGLEIENPDCVSKSYPGFYKDLEKLVENGNN